MDSTNLLVLNQHIVKGYKSRNIYLPFNLSFNISPLLKTFRPSLLSTTGILMIVGVPAPVSPVSTTSALNSLKGFRISSVLSPHSSLAARQSSPTQEWRQQKTDCTGIDSKSSAAATFNELMGFLALTAMSTRLSSALFSTEFT